MRPSYLEQEIPRQAEAILRAAATSRDQIAGLGPRSPGTEHLVLTGCGDSLFAAKLIQAMATADGRRGVVAAEALEFSRYSFKTVDERSVVAVLSYSGETVRVREAAVAAKSRGARVIAVTRDRRGQLAGLADDVLSYPDLAERSNTRTSSFQAAIVVLSELLDALRGDDGMAPEPRPWAAVAAWVESAVRDAPADLARLDGIGATERVDEVLYLGAGPGLVAASYGAAKAYEAATIRARAVELEEFCHCEIFSVSPGTPVVVILPEGPTADRGAEVLAALAELGAFTICLSNCEELTKEAVARVVRLPRDMPEVYTPMVAAPFLQLLALRWALARGDDPDLVQNKRVNSPLIRAAGAWSPADYQSLR